MVLSILHIGKPRLGAAEQVALRSCSQGACLTPMLREGGPRCPRDTSNPELLPGCLGGSIS